MNKESPEAAAWAYRIGRQGSWYEQELQVKQQEMDMKKSLSSIWADYPIRFAYLFGSHAAGHTHRQSDVDIAIYPKKGLTRSQAFQLRVKVMEAIMDALHESRVDVIDLREAPLPLRFRAIQPAQLLFSRDETERVHFEVATRSEYFDRLPLIDRSNAVAFARMAKVGLR